MGAFPAATLKAASAAFIPPTGSPAPPQRGAGRSPSYLVRQLYEFKHGLRNGPMTASMRANTEEMSEPEMVALAAYAASLRP